MIEPAKQGSLDFARQDLAGRQSSNEGVSIDRVGNRRVTWRNMEGSMNLRFNHSAFMTLSSSCETCPGGERLLIETAERVLPTQRRRPIRWRFHGKFQSQAVAWRVCPPAVGRPIRPLGLPIPNSRYATLSCRPPRIRPGRQLPDLRTHPGDPKLPHDFYNCYVGLMIG